ncbi:MAG TPA: phage baseplate assembly protein V [Allocoleopsis sp.]
MSQEKFHGKYRATVVNNKDPLGLGRIQVQVSDATGILPSLTWVKPSSPHAGLQTGTYVLPPFGAAAWIEFEQGDPNYPVCSGFHWGGLPQTPLLTQIVDKQIPPEVPFMMMQTMTQSGFLLSETPIGAPVPLAGPGVVLFTQAGLAHVKLDALGVTIQSQETIVNVSPVGINIVSLKPIKIATPMLTVTGAITAAAVTAPLINGKSL